MKNITTYSALKFLKYSFAFLALTFTCGCVSPAVNIYSSYDDKFPDIAQTTREAVNEIPSQDFIFRVCSDVETKIIKAQGKRVPPELVRNLCEMAAATCKNLQDNHCKNVLNSYDTDLRAQGSSMLMSAAYAGCTEVVGTMIDMGRDPNKALANGWTPLMIAAAEGHAGAVTALLNRRADPNIRNRLGRSALMFASQYGFTGIVNSLLEHGANPNIVPNDETGATALIVAVRRGHVETLKILLEKGAGESIKDKVGKTALMWAQELGNPEIVRTLTKK